MIDNLISLYSPRFATTLVYMLQTTEYQVWPYIKWFWRTKNFGRIMQRAQLETTGAAKLLVWLVRLGVLAEILIGLVLIGLNINGNLNNSWEIGVALILAYPAVIAHLVVLPLWLGRQLIINPKEKKLIIQSKKTFGQFRGVKIAIAGSYGKTSMKELLLTVLGEGKNVVATPANNNVPVSHARFAKSLTGKEDILIIEYGEGTPGDVHRFAQTTQPSHGVITGVAAAHLDHYKTVKAAGEDIFSLAEFLKEKNVYVNGDSAAAKPFIKKEFHRYDGDGALGWKVSNPKVTIHGTSFKLTKAKKSFELHSKLIGQHQLGPLSLAAALAHELGLSDEQIVEGVNKTAPFEHRMQPNEMSGAWIIDDTYNGNIEGIRAGTQLLRSLSAKRKWYVTPGLVDQGSETEKIHLEMGELIAVSAPEIVVLMENSVTKFIRQGLENNGYKGELRLEKHPLHFYTNLGEIIAAGDLVMMQNDWTDNYA